MRYQLELDIDLPRERVIELFLETENLTKWQPDLVSIEHIGEIEPRAVGAKTKQVHRMGRREVEMIETITAHNYPEEFSATYEADGIWNFFENRFNDAGAQKTRWILDSEVKCTGLAQLMILIMPGAFKKQTFMFMNRFKAFAEGAGS